MKQKATVLGIDLAKRVFHLVGMDDAGHVVLKKRLTREALLPFIAQVSPVIIGMEAWVAPIIGHASFARMAIR
jgi:transposase